MSDKTKKIIENIGWAVTAVGVISLVAVGVSEADIGEAVDILQKAVTAVGVAIAFIFGKMKK